MCKLHKPCISDSKLNIILLLVLEYEQTSIHIKINNFQYGFPPESMFLHSKIISILQRHWQCRVGETDWAQ